jgi:hypothetical protein
MVLATPVSLTDFVPTVAENPEENLPISEDLDLSPETIEGSPVLQRWLEEIPNLWEEIHHDPSFSTRLRWGYIRLSDDEDVDGWRVGMEDVFIDRTGLTLSGEYEQMGNGSLSLGADLRYYLLPLGGFVNLAPVVGYRYLEQDREIHDGLNVGIRMLVILSRGGGSDLSIAQIWVAPRSNEEVSLTTLSVAYALTRHLRLSTDFQRQNGEGRIGIFMEWMP